MGRPRINDEFAGLEVSRQRRYQLRKKVAGLCNFCGSPSEVGRDGQPTQRCLKHAVYSREWKRARKLPHARRKRGTSTYRIQAAKVYTHFFPPDQEGKTLCGLNSPALRGTSDAYAISCPRCFKHWPQWKAKEYRNQQNSNNINKG